MNVVDQITLERFDTDEWGYPDIPESEFPLTETIEVLRQTSEGYATVPFELIGETGNTRRLSLVDPQPGAYVVSWQGETCGSDPAPNGSGIAISEFDLGEMLPVPESLGTLAAGDSTVVEKEVNAEGGGGECVPPKTDAIVAQTSVDLTLEADVVPWAEVIRLEVYVDGEYDTALHFLEASDIAAGGPIPFSIETVCSSEEPAAKYRSWGEGTHQVTVRATLADGTELETAAESVTLSCEGADDLEGGCTVAAPGKGSGKDAPWALVAAAALVAGLRRRRTSPKSA